MSTRSRRDRLPAAFASVNDSIRAGRDPVYSHGRASGGGGGVPFGTHETVNWCQGVRLMKSELLAVSHEVVQMARHTRTAAAGARATRVRLPEQREPGRAADRGHPLGEERGSVGGG